LAVAGFSCWHLRHFITGLGGHSLDVDRKSVIINAVTSKDTQSSPFQHHLVESMPGKAQKMFSGLNAVANE
jgi:hypothetical protein